MKLTKEFDSQVIIRELRRLERLAEKASDEDNVRKLEHYKKLADSIADIARMTKILIYSK